RTHGRREGRGALARAPRGRARPRAPDHRGPDGRRRGPRGGTRYGRTHAEAVGRKGRRVTTSAEIAVERRDAAIVAHLSGEVDMTNSRYVGNELAGAVPNDAAALVVDL